jgi:nucleolar pre-ribosomal-associated protein 2
MRHCQDCVRELELLIARHVVLPTRASYFACSNAKKGDVDANVSYFGLDALFKELPFFERPVVKDTLTPVSKLVPRFLDIALRAAPRRSLRQQSIENPWLETLFVALSELAGFSPRFSPPKNGAQSVEPLEELLDVALLGNLPLSLNLLRDYTSKHSRILEDTNITFAKKYDSGLSPCEWSLLAKIIRLGVDIFIPNSGVKDALPILSATLKKATVLRLAPSTQADQYYTSITTNIIIPIMEGFARARDLGAFLDHWYHQLDSFSVNFTEEDLQKSSKRLSVWEGQDLTTAFSNLAPSSFTVDQIKHQFALAAQDLSSSENDSAVFRRAMNRAVIVDSLLQSELSEDYHSSLTQAIDHLRDVTSTAVSNQSSQYSLYQWRLWCLLRRIAEYSPRDSISANRKKEESLLSLSQMVPQVIHRVLNPGGTYKWQDFAEAFEAFQYLTVSMTRAGYPHDTKTMNSATEAINTILGIETYSYDTLSSLEWDGGIQSIDSHLRLSLANALVTANNPQFLIYISSETRQQLFRGLCRLARDSSRPIQKEDVESEEPLFRCVWRILATHENIMSSAPVWEDFINVQIAEIEHYGLDYVALEILGGVSPDFVSRPRRTKALDLSLQCILKFGDRLQGSSLANIMALMIAILDCVNPSALILTDGGVLWNLIEATRLNNWDTAACTVLENLATSVLGSFAVSKSGKRSQEYCETFIKRMPILMRKYKTFYDEPAMLSLCKASIPLLWSHKDALLDTSLHTELVIIRQEYVNTIISDLGRIQSGNANISLSNVDFLVCSMIDSLSPFEDLLDQHDRLSDILDKIATDFSQRRLLSPLINISVQARGDLINTEILAIKLLFETGTTPLSTTLENLTKTLDSPLLDVETRQKVLKATKEIATRSDSDDVLNFLSSISVPDALNDTPRSQLFVVGIVASSIDSQVDKDSSVSTMLSSIFGDLTQRTPQASSIEDFCLTIDCLGLILRSHSRSVSQWNVDNALGMIRAVTSVAGPRLDHVDPAVMVRNGGIVFGRLCDLMGSVLAAHRKKVGGRFHLVVAALQGLLRCLFIPETRKAQSSSPALPPWIPVGKEVLGHDHAVQYSRLLTMICDPTVSSVKKAKSSQAQHLTDETKKARGVAGQYLQYVVREYTLCQLGGRVSPKVKSALMPGLYAVLDAMSRDGMRAMNAAMDSSSRAVFKSLYDDYRRFGKWDQS